MNAHVVPIPARGSTFWQEEIPGKLVSSLDALDLNATEAFAELGKLAEQVSIDGYSLDIESAVIEGHQWVVPGTIFVDLTYDLASNDPVTMNDAYPIEVRFHLDTGEVRIDSVTTDTSSFFE